MPKRSARTRSGISAATAVTRSTSSPSAAGPATKSSTMARALSSIDARSRSIDRGVKTGWRIRRSRVCCGWSMFSIIWRNIARLSSASDGRNVPPASDEKRSWSRSTSSTRAWAVTAQNPGLSTNWSRGLSPSRPATGGSACHATPPCSRSASNAACGTPARNAAPPDRSTGAASATSRAPGGGVAAAVGQTRTASVGVTMGGNVAKALEIYGATGEEEGRMGDELAGKVAVITGGGAGLGAAMGHAFAAPVPASRSSTSTRPPRRRLPPRSPSSTAYRRPSHRVDVGDARSIASAAAPRPSRRWAGVTCCVPTSACSSSARSTGSPTTTGGSCSTSTCSARSAPSRAFLPLLRARDGYRRIVLTASLSVLAPAVRMAAYQTSKFAVMGFGETLRARARRRGHRRQPPVPRRHDDRAPREQRPGPARRP